MRQKYKVFLNERYVLLTNEWPKNLLKSKTFLALQHSEKSSMRQAFESFEKNDSIHKLVIINNDVEEIWNKFQSFFEIIPAAGGLVFNEKKEVLMIFRRGSWDLPKGKLEKNEKLKKCAVREVEEECGLENVKLLEKICVTHHIYTTKSGTKLKPSHWYEMKVKGTPDLVPQEEEDIEKAVWVDMNEAEKLLKSAFPSIKEVFKAYKKD